MDSVLGDDLRSNIDGTFRLLDIQMNISEELSKAGRYNECKEIIAEIISSIKDGINAQMDKVPMVQTEMHTKLILSRQLLNQFDKHIQTVIDTGKMAEFSLAQEEEKKRFKMFG